MPGPLSRGMQAHQRSASRCSRQFSHCGLEHIHAHPGEAFGDGWHAGLGRLGAWGLPAVVLNDLTVLGEALGVSDVEDQRRHLQVTRLRLEDAYRQAEQEWRTNWKLWSYLGFAAGLLILLLIF